MTAIIYYIDFHWDNHQGGSGKSFEMRYTVRLPKELQISDLKEFLINELHEHIKKQRPFQQTDSASIQRIEII